MCEAQQAAGHRARRFQRLDKPDDGVLPRLDKPSEGVFLRRATKKRQRGFILVKALIVIAGLVALIAILAAYQRAALQTTQIKMRRRRAEVAVQSAMARAVAVLQNANANLVAPTDDWIQLGDNANEEFELGDIRFRMQIVDAGSLININTASAAELGLLPIDQEHIDCLLDWRETGMQPRSDGAKDTYYNGLTQPYNTKLGRLTTVNELLLVKNWTARDLYLPPENVTSSAPLPEDVNGNPLPLASLLTTDSGSPNTQANGAPRVNLGRAGINENVIERMGINAAQAAIIARRVPYNSFRDLLSQPGLSPQTQRTLLNEVTFAAGTRIEGKINLNTAPQATLQTIPNVTPDIASAIISRQASGFTGLGDLATIPGVSGPLLGQIATSVTVGTDTWIVRIYGESSGTGIAVEAVVTLANGRARIKTWNRLSTSGIPAWWDWQAETTSTVDAGTGT